MTRIVVFIKNDLIVGYQLKGHAGADEYGKDIVCAGLSAISIGGANALTDGEDNYDVEIKKGYLSLKRIHGFPSEHDRIVLETIVTQLEGVVASNGNYATLERKEVK